VEHMMRRSAKAIAGRPLKDGSKLTILFIKIF